MLSAFSTSRSLSREGQLREGEMGGGTTWQCSMRRNNLMGSERKRTETEEKARVTKVDRVRRGREGGRQRRLPLLRELELPFEIDCVTRDRQR